MSEASKARRREWQRENPDKIKQYTLNRLRRKYLAEFLAERKKETEIGKGGGPGGQIITT